MGLAVERHRRRALGKALRRLRLACGAAGRGLERSLRAGAEVGQLSARCLRAEAEGALSERLRALALGKPRALAGPCDGRVPARSVGEHAVQGRRAMRLAVLAPG